jgi:hypothetical protein
MEIYDVVKKLIGEIDPIRETNEDEKRFVNLKETINLVDKLIAEIAHVSTCKSEIAYSANRAGQEAYYFIKDVRDFLEDYIEE